jgi:hypothetical protein
MIHRALRLAGAVVAFSGWTEISAAQSVQPCPDLNRCVHLAVGSRAGAPGENVRVALSFVQGPNDGHPGGIDEIATLALTIDIAGNQSPTPLVLADCTLDAHGLPNAIHLGASISDFTVVVQNATCSSNRPHCLCPDPGSGIAPDGFINLAIYGPPPTPAPGLDTVQIPPLPASGLLLTIDLTIQPGASGTIPLHVFAPWSDSERPPLTAFVSAGDVLATDQTCVPAAGMPPCGGAAPVSQLSVVDGAVAVVVPTSSKSPTGVPTSSLTPTATSAATSTIAPTETPTGTPAVTIVPSATPTATPQPSLTATAETTTTVTASPALTPTATVPSPTPTCIGDCNGDSRVTVDETLTMVNIGLGTTALQTCGAGDANGDGKITVDEILASVNNALNGCSSVTGQVVAPF